MGIHVAETPKFTPELGGFIASGGKNSSFANTDQQQNLNPILNAVNSQLNAAVKRQRN